MSVMYAAAETFRKLYLHIRMPDRSQLSQSILGNVEQSFSISIARLQRW